MGSKFSKKKQNSNNGQPTIIKLADPAPDPAHKNINLHVVFANPSVPQTTQLKTPTINAEEGQAEIDLYKADRYTPQPGLNNKILLYGFMRDIEKILSGASAMQIIPFTIMQLCDAYYSTPNIIFYFERVNDSNCLYIVDLDDMDRELTKKHIFNYNNTLITDLDTNAIQSAGMYYKSKLKLPSTIINKLPDKLRQNTDTNTYFDAIIKCGGTAVSRQSMATNFCCAYIWKYADKYFENICQIKLPNYPSTSSIGQSLIWSDKRQCLFSIARSSMNVLLFNDLKDWKWERQCSLINSFGMDRKRIGFMSSVIVENDFGAERLICVGGSVPNSGIGVKYCDLYDINADKWMKISDMNFARHRTGIYHDKWTQKIFIGGGNGAERKIEFYDLNKNKWYFDKTNIPYTKCKHNVYPIIWKKDGHLLYIASVKANAVEFIDLRQDNNTWNCAYNTLDPLFNTNIVWYNAANCRLIQ